VGPSGTLEKGQGCAELILDYGAQKAEMVPKMPSCHYMLLM